VLQDERRTGGRVEIRVEGQAGFAVGRLVGTNVHKVIVP
jgi:hypothetical protein